MAADPTEGAVNQVENKVAASGGDVSNPAVTAEVTAALTSQDNGNIINNPGMTQAFATRLENEGILPSMVIDQFKAGNLDQWKTGENLDRAKVEKAAADPNESALNRMMAQALLKRYKDLDTTAGDGLSRAELTSWASRQTRSEDGSVVSRDGAGRPVNIEHPFNTTEGKPAQTVITRDADGNPTKITPPAGTGFALEMKDGKWQIQGAPDPSSEIKDVKVLPDGTYSFTFKNASSQYTVTQKTDGSTIFTKPTGEVTQVHIHDGGPLRAFEAATDSDGAALIKTNDGKQTYKQLPDGSWQSKEDPSLKYKSITAAPDGTVTFVHANNYASVYNTDRSMVQLDDKGQPVSIRYADGKERGFTRNANGNLTHVVENGVSKPITNGTVDRGGNLSYDENGKRITIHSTGKQSDILLDAAPRVEEPAPVPSDKRTDGSTIVVSADGKTITRTNIGGNETETITKRDDGSAQIQRKGADGSTTTEFAKAGTFKEEIVNGKVVGYSFTTEGGAEVKQHADGRREYTVAPGMSTMYTYGEDGKPNKIEHKGAGGVTETLTLGANGEWSISRPDNSAGGKVDAVRINSDGSYSYLFMGTKNTQETTRNIREEMRPNGDALRIGFDREGKPEFVVRNYTTGGQRHQEELKMADGKWQVTVDGKPVDAKDIKVYPGGGYEYARNDNGIKIYQDGNTRRETRPDGVQVESTVLPSGDTQSKTTYANGDTHAIITSPPQGEPPRSVMKSIVHFSKETGRTETISAGEDGKPRVVVTDAANPNSKIEGTNLKLNQDGSYSYDLPLDPANPAKMRHIEQKADGSRSEVTREPYVVQGGDYLYKLAKQRGVSLQDIIDAQPPELQARLKKNPNLILKGETLIMPSDKKEVAAPAATPTEGTPRPTDAGDREDYTVKPGDTLTKIAKDRNLTVDALIAEIKGFDPELGKRLEENRNFIRSGEKLPVRKRK